jgi:hypothetical protein
LRILAEKIPEIEHFAHAKVLEGDVPTRVELLKL